MLPGLRAASSSTAVPVPQTGTRNTVPGATRIDASALAATIRSTNAARSGPDAPGATRSATSHTVVTVATVTVTSPALTRPTVIWPT